MSDKPKSKILFVDDEPNILQGLARMLKPMRKSWDMRFVQDAAEALRIMDQEDTDVLVADMRMPGMDGAQLLSAVKERHPGVVRIVLSGHSEEIALMKVVKTAHQFLSKPSPPELVTRTILRALKLRDYLNSPAIRRVLNKIETLPALPEVYTQIMSELNRQEPSIDRAAKIIAQDIGMTAAILKLVNSAFFGLPRTIESPNQAVALLGLDTVKALVLGVHFFSRFEMRKKTLFSFAGLWSHSQTTASFARAIALLEKGSNEVVNNSFICGLLHDVGKLIMHKEFPDVYTDILAKVRKRNQSVWRVEKDVLGVSHSEVGAYLLGLWGLPEPVVEAVAFHHEPALLEDQSFAFSPVTALHAANCLERELVVINPDFDRPYLDLDFLEQVGLKGRIDPWRESCRETLTGDA